MAGVGDSSIVQPGVVSKQGTGRRLRFSPLATLLLVGAVGTGVAGFLLRPPDDAPPTVPAAPTFVLDLHLQSAVPPAWDVRTNLVEDGSRSWLVLSFGPAPQVPMASSDPAQQSPSAPSGPAQQVPVASVGRASPRGPVAYSFTMLAYGVPVAGSPCGLREHSYRCFGATTAKALYPNEHGLLFPPPAASFFPTNGSIHVITGSGGAGSVVLPFVLHHGSEPVVRKGSFLSFSLPPVILDVSDADDTPITSRVTFDTELGTTDLRTVTLTAGNAPSSTLRDPTVNKLDPQNRFLTSWLWDESDTLTAGAGATANAQSTPVTVSAATNVANAQVENRNAFISGVLWGIAGGALVGFLQEFLQGWGRKEPGTDRAP